MKNLIDKHLRNKTVTRNQLNDAQNVYTRGKSTTVALKQLVGKVAKLLDDHQIALFPFFNIRGVYNNTPNDFIKITSIKRELNPSQSDGSNPS